MSWFGLDPQSTASRVSQSKAVAIPTLEDSVTRGVLGFTLVSVAGFAPWAIFGRWLHKAVGEAGMYAACAIVFIGLSGLALHRLIIGPGSLGRFYKLFGTAFAVYSAAWIIGWMSLGGNLGGIAGLLAGTAAMGWIFCRAFDARSATVRTIGALFVLNTAGYFSGGWAENTIAHWNSLSIGTHVLAKSSRYTLAMLSWGVCYGAGFGAGLGLAFYFCQEPIRRLLANRESNPAVAG